MIEEVVEGIFRLEIPLPGNPLRSINSYLIRDSHRNLLVDTGFNWEACRLAQIEAMRQLKVDWSTIDFFTTHVHGDHSGLVLTLADSSSSVFCSRVDADLMRACMTEGYWQQINERFFENGFPTERSGHQAATMTNFIAGTDLNFCYVGEGDILEIGNYHLHCIETPGHSPGHICLYEPDHKFLFSGDHILDDITPNITPWPGIVDSLGLYLQSLDKVEAMEIEKILPGHRSVILDFRRRIEEIRHHHQVRLNEILAILDRCSGNAYEVASHMKWDLTYESWEDFPGFQKWFATGEAMAHLEHLLHLGKIRTEKNQDQLIYQKVK